MAKPLPLSSWEEQVREIQRKTEGPFLSAWLDQAEQQANREGQRRAHAWLAALWPLVFTLYPRWDKRAQERVWRASQDPVRTVDIAHEIATAAFRAAGEDSAKQLRATARAARQAGEPLREPRVPSGAPRKPPPGPPAPDSVRRHAEWIARTSAATKMREWALGMREDVRWQVVAAIREGIPAQELAKRLEERWDHYGQHFSLIATTELSTAYNEGYLLAMPEHSYVYVPPIGDGRVCEKCRTLLEGKVFEVLHHRPEHVTRQDAETRLWVGKGRLWNGRDVPTLPQHPNCRHLGVFYSGRPLEKGWVKEHTRRSPRGTRHEVRGYWRDDSPVTEKRTWRDYGLADWRQQPETMKYSGMFKPIESVDELQSYLASLADVFLPDKNGCAAVPTQEGFRVSLTKELYQHWKPKRLPSERMNVDTGEEADRRVRYFRGVVDTLLHPTEIWRQPTSDGADGRVYVRTMQVQGEPERHMVVFVGFRDHVPVLVSFIPTTEPRKVNAKRWGDRIFPLPESLG